MNLTDHDAELALLGAVLLEPSVYDGVSDLWRPEMFASESHRLVARAMHSMMLAGKPVDWVSVNSELNGAVDSQLTFMLQQSIGSTGNVRAYAERLSDLWAKRELVTAAEKSIAAVKSGEGAATSHIDGAVRSLMGIELGHVARARDIGSVYAEFYRNLEEAKKTGNIRGSSKTGLGALDSHTGGLRPGVLCVFAARPGSGKSSLAIAIADNLASAGTPVGCFWLEDDATDFARRITARRLRIEAARLRDANLDVVHLHQLRQAQEKIASLPIYIDDEHGLTATEIASRMRRMAREHGVKVFIADHLGEILMEKSETWADRPDLAIGRACKIFRDTAKELGASPILFHQMNRAVEKRAGKKPQLSDLEGSGQIEQAARFIGFLHRPEDREDTLVICIEKNTNGKTGIEVELAWDGARMAVDNRAPIVMPAYPGEADV